jgi:hypothetical protein
MYPTYSFRRSSRALPRMTFSIDGDHLTCCISPTPLLHQLLRLLSPIGSPQQQLRTWCSKRDSRGRHSNGSLPALAPERMSQSARDRERASELDTAGSSHPGYPSTKIHRCFGKPVSVAVRYFEVPLTSNSLRRHFVLTFPHSCLPAESRQAIDVLLSLHHGRSTLRRIPAKSYSRKDRGRTLLKIL